MLNNGGSSSYTFNANGSFTFVYQTATGETGSVEAQVDWIYDALQINELFIAQEAIGVSST